MHVLSWTSEIVQLYLVIACFEDPVYLVCKPGELTALSGSCRTSVVWEYQVYFVYSSFYMWCKNP